MLLDVLELLNVDAILGFLILSRGLRAADI